MNVDWDIKDSERPDFIVRAAGRRFGLEVTQVHVDEQAASEGSVSRASEAMNSRWLSDILQRFREHTPCQLDLKFLGWRSLENAAFITDVLDQENFGARPIGHAVKRSKYGVTIWATKSFVSRCTFFKDSVGWVSRSSAPFVEAVTRKARNLTAYRGKVPDVRLLMIADRTANSGKITVDANATVPLCGFDALYLFSFPDTLVEISAAGIATHRRGRTP